MGKFYWKCTSEACGGFSHWHGDAQPSRFSQGGRTPQFPKGVLYLDLVEASTSRPESEHALLLRSADSSSQGPVVFDYQRLARDDMERVALYYGLKVFGEMGGKKSKEVLGEEILAMDRQSVAKGWAPGHQVVDRVAAKTGQQPLDPKKGRKRKRVA